MATLLTAAGLMSALLVASCSEDEAVAPEPSPQPPESQREEFLAMAQAIHSSDNPFLGSAQIQTLQAQLDDPSLPDLERASTLMQLSFEQLRLGRPDEAVAAIELALSLSDKLELSAASMLGLLRLQSLTYLRQAEIENCIERHNAECCLLPLAGGGVHRAREPALRAQAALQRVLALEPSSLEARWLINLVAMALGDWPDGVRRDVLIPVEAFRSQVEFDRFVNVAPALGVDTFNECGGVVIEDLDGDGRLDIVTSSFGPDEPLTFYRGEPGGSFSDHSSQSWLDDQLGGLNIIGGDYDDDGDIDLLILRGAWLYDDGAMRNSLLRNDGQAVFTDVTRAAGLAEPAAPTQAACFGDFDLDGDLDLYVGNESRAQRQPAGTSYLSQLFVNNGDGTFTDRAVAAGVTNDRHVKGVTAGDFDNDGDLDLYVSNLDPNRLYRNDGALTFVDVAEELQVAEPRGRSFASWFFDYDNDGRLDLFVAAFSATVADVAADHLGFPDLNKRPRLYHNIGAAFEEVTVGAGLGHPWLPMGANFGDIDHDGWLDIYLATGDPGYETLTPNIMLRNDGNGHFDDVSASAGLGHLQKGHGVAFADFDGDGDQDIYNQLGGFYPGDGFHNALFENPGNGNHFVYVRLVGTTTNHFGFGARIQVTLEQDGQQRSVHRSVGSVSSFGGSPFRQEIGLGQAERIVSVRVDWPASGTTQVFDDIPLDSVIEVTEGVDSWRQLPLH
jgi:hypothetical protein